MVQVQEGEQVIKAVILNKITAFLYFLNTVFNEFGINKRIEEISKKKVSIEEQLAWIDDMRTVLDNSYDKMISSD